MTQSYIHGYDPLENQRLQDQSVTLMDLLHADTVYPEGSRVLEAGCGVGAQTVILARQSPGAIITSVDISEDSVAAARKAVEKAGLRNVTVQQGDIFDLPFAPDSFDHIFLCFVLKHLPRPAEALEALRSLLKPGGTLTAIEGDHGSTFFSPECKEADWAIRCLEDLQARTGGNARIGRQLYPLLRKSGFDKVHVTPRFVYADTSHPDLVEGFTKKTFAAMIEGVRRPVLEAKLMTTEEFDRGMAGLYRAAESDGVFCYTFFKVKAVKSA